MFIVIIDTEIQCKALGMKVEVFDPSGNNIEGTGTPGELVCTRPHPSIPVKFWGDTPDRKKLKETYYSTYPGWCSVAMLAGGWLIPQQGCGGKATLWSLIRRQKVF